MVGVLQDEQKMSYEVYGEGGERLGQTEYRYEIGSVTKTMTAALTSRTILEGKLHLTDTIDKYLELPDGKVYPTVESLLSVLPCWGWFWRRFTARITQACSTLIWRMSFL